MKRISKSALKLWDGLADELFQREESLRASVEEAREKIEGHIMTINEALLEIQELLEAVEVGPRAAQKEQIETMAGWLEDHIGLCEEYQSERSEAWHESNAADAYYSWVEDFNERRDVFETCIECESPIIGIECPEENPDIDQACIYVEPFEFEYLTDNDCDYTILPEAPN